MGLKSAFQFETLYFQLDLGGIYRSLNNIRLINSISIMNEGNVK
jgi:hypothetical protein